MELLQLLALPVLLGSCAGSLTSHAVLLQGCKPYRRRRPQRMRSDVRSLEIRGTLMSGALTVSDGLCGAHLLCSAAHCMSAALTLPACCDPQELDSELGPHHGGHHSWQLPSITFGLGELTWAHGARVTGVAIPPRGQQPAESEGLVFRLPTAPAYVHAQQPSSARHGSISLVHPLRDASATCPPVLVVRRLQPEQELGPWSSTGPTGGRGRH